MSAASSQSSAQSRPLLVFAQVGFVVAAAVLVYSFVAVTREAEYRRRCGAACVLHPSYMGANRSAPKFTLTDSKGQQVSLDQYKGKVVILNFWTTNCGPCMAEMPELAELAKILKDRPDTALVTVSVDEDPKDAVAKVKSEIRKNSEWISAKGDDELPFSVLFDPDSKVVKGKFGTSLFPETWIIDKNGVIRARFDGPKQWSSASVVELIDDIRGGGYCPVDIAEKGGRVEISGAAAKLCQDQSQNPG
jgi:peroxiredoxin